MDLQQSRNSFSLEDQNTFVKGDSKIFLFVSSEVDIFPQRSKDDYFISDIRGGVLK